MVHAKGTRKKRIEDKFNHQPARSNNDRSTAPNSA